MSDEGLDGSEIEAMLDAIGDLAEPTDDKPNHRGWWEP